MSSVIGDTLILQGLIGEGNSAKVLMAVDGNTGVKYAIKIFKKANLKESMTNVAREIEVLSKCDHPSIVKLYNVTENDEEICLYMEYVPCGELYDLIAQNTTLTEVEARGIFEEMVNVVSYLHSIGITHRDIKPENILIDEFGHIKLCDFGMSNIFEPNQLLYTPCGSPHYSAPELILGKGYHPQQSEVWTLGILLYACCCGTLPFLHENTPKLFQLICEGVFDFPEIQLSSTLKDLVRKMLVVEPEKRLTFDQILDHEWVRCSEKLSSKSSDLVYDFSAPNSSIVNLTSKSDLRFADTNTPASFKPRARTLSIHSTSNYNFKTLDTTSSYASKMTSGSFFSGYFTNHPISRKPTLAGFSIDESPLKSRVQNNLNHTPSPHRNAESVDETMMFTVSPALKPSKKPIESTKMAAPPDISFMSPDKIRGKDERYSRLHPPDISLTFLSPDKVRGRDGRMFPPDISLATPERIRSSRIRKVSVDSFTESPSKMHRKNSKSAVTPNIRNLNREFLLEPGANISAPTVMPELSVNEIKPVALNAAAALRASLPRVVPCRPENTPLTPYSNHSSLAVANVSPENGLITPNESFSSPSKLLSHFSNARLLDSPIVKPLISAPSPALRPISISSAGLNKNSLAIFEKETVKPKIHRKSSLGASIISSNGSSHFDDCSMYPILSAVSGKSNLKILSTIGSPVVHPLSVSIKSENSSLGFDYMHQKTCSEWFIAAEEGNSSKVESMLMTGMVELNSRGIDNWNIFHFAARKGHANVIKCVLDFMYNKNSDSKTFSLLNAVNKNSWTPLMMASFGGHDEVVSLLVNAGADVYTKNNQNQTAVDLTNNVTMKNLLLNSAIISSTPI